MRVLVDGGGTWLIPDTDDCDEMRTYDENGWEWEETGCGFLRCGEAELFDDVEIDGDEDGECYVTISFLHHRGGARYDRVAQKANFVGGEMVGQWEDD